MLRCLLVSLLLAGCSAGVQSTSTTDGASESGVANFSFCFGFCLHRVGPPLVITPAAPPVVATPKKR